jgi:hypothetical protein
MSKYAIEEWFNEANGMDLGVTPYNSPSGSPPSGAAGMPGSMAAPTDPNVANPAPKKTDPAPKDMDQGGDDPGQQPDVTMDPQAPDMPQEMEEKDFEQWKDSFFKESMKGDVNKLIDMIHQVRDLSLDAYPRKFVEDNLQILFLRQNANIDKASKEIRKLLKEEIDQNNPAVSLVNHVSNVLQEMPELNNVFIKLKGLLGAKGDLHRKFEAALLGAVQVGSGANNEDIIFNEKEYAIKISTRYNDKWGMVDIGKWSLREDDPERYLTDPEQSRLEEGSPEEKDVLRRRVVMESICETFKKRAFVVNVVSEDGTVYTLGWNLAQSLRSAYTDGKLVVRTIESENSEAMIDNQGAIIPYVDVKIKYVKQTGVVDEDGKPAKEEHDFMERIDGMLFLTAQMNIIREASSSFQGIVMKETPYTGNPSDLRILQRCVPGAGEMLLRQC